MVNEPARPPLFEKCRDMPAVYSNPRIADFSYPRCRRDSFSIFLNEFLLLLGSIQRDTFERVFLNPIHIETIGIFNR